MEQVAKAIGYIVYAVASADKHVAEEEKKIAHDLINEHWTLLADNEDPFGVQALDFVDKIIVSFDEDHLDSEKAFEQFQAIYSERNQDFTKEIKQLNDTLLTIMQLSNMFPAKDIIFSEVDIKNLREKIAEKTDKQSTKLNQFQQLNMKLVHYM